MLERFKNIIFAAIALAIVGGIVVLLTYRPAPVVITIIPPGPTPTASPIHVYITGAVANPDTYTLAYGSRVQDAIDAAGGTSSTADLNSMNLAQVVHDGDKVNVPAQPGQPAQSASAGSSGVPTLDPNAVNLGSPDAAGTPAKGKSTKGSGPVHINSGTLADLQGLPGVGPSLAQKILDYRNAHGPFHNLDDLKNVSGIGASRLQKWADLILFD